MMRSLGVVCEFRRHACSIVGCSKHANMDLLRGVAVKIVTAS